MDRERNRVAASELSWALRAMTRANTAVEHELARRLGLRPLDYTAMTYLIDARDPIGPAELGSYVGISSGSATELVDRLERDGHLLREPHPRDRRRLSLRATEESIGRLLQELRPLLAEMDQLADQFDDREREAIQRYLHTVAGHMDDYVEASHDGLPVRGTGPRA